MASVFRLTLAGLAVLLVGWFVALGYAPMCPAKSSCVAGSVEALFTDCNDK